MPANPTRLSELADSWEKDIADFVHPVGPLGSAGYLQAAGHCIKALRRTLAADPQVAVSAFIEVFDTDMSRCLHCWAIWDDSNPEGHLIDKPACPVGAAMAAGGDADELV